MHTTKELLHYDYYLIECLNINRDNNSIKALYPGLLHRPNITYSKNNIETFFNSQTMEIVSPEHNNIQTIDGEIKICHTSSTSTDVLLVYFPFKYKVNTTTTSIDLLLKSSETNVFYSSIGVDMSMYINKDCSITQYNRIENNGINCRVLVFNDIINIASNSTVTRYLQTSRTEILHKQSLQDKLHSNAIIYKSRIKNNTDTKESFENKSKEDATIVDENIIYSCEYLPIETDGEMIQVLQVPLHSPALDTLVNSNISTLIVYNIIILFFLLVTFFLSPHVYRILVVCINKTQYSTLLLQRLPFFTSTSVNALGIISILSSLSVAVIFFIYGIISKSRMYTTIGIFLPFYIFFTYIGIRSGIL